MTRHIHVVTVLILITNIERTFGLNPPEDVKLVGSNLQWKPGEVNDSVLYSLQYNRNSTKGEWLNVSRHFGTQFNITPEFYGAVFRVRAEKGNELSAWQYSNPVQCVNVKSCVPVVNLIVTPVMVSLTMAHMDESLEKEYGEHIEFNISIWKVVNEIHQKVQSFITNHKKEPMKDLEPGQTYCFQVEYLHYGQRYGNATEKKCVVIPETPEIVRRNFWLSCILTTLFVSAMCGVFIFILIKHHKKLKRCLQPLQLEIPDHYREVLYNGFPLQACPSPSSQSLPECDMITVMENRNEEQNDQKEEQEKRSFA
ncbi:interferon gamma receptor 2 [Pseudorasbora parva]|uniref:interferon gamma receptor 2 n=1 Tax=Pseudorasbora parva TaxID=51549 RepID=UPI00351F103E